MLEVSKSAAIFTRLNIIRIQRRTKNKRSAVRKVIFGFREIQWMVWSIETFSTKSPIESSTIYILIHTNRFNYKISSNPCDSSNSLEISHRFSNLKILKNIRKLKQQDTNGQSVFFLVINGDKASFFFKKLWNHAIWHPTHLTSVSFLVIN